MYNLTVEGAHTFFVGEGQWLVHNTNPFFTCVKGNLPASFYENSYRKVDAGDLTDALHANKHSVSKATQVDVLNNWDNMFTGVNYSARAVDVYYRSDGTVVITAVGDKTQVITSYTGADISRWTTNPKPGEIWWSFNRNKQR